MARGRTITAADEQVELANTAPAQGELDTGFGAEFRELARQRRFVRSESTVADSDTAEQSETGSDWREAAATGDGSWRQHAAPAASDPVTPASPPRQRVSLEPQATPSLPAASPAPAANPTPNRSHMERRPARMLDARLSDDHRGTIRELARLSDRLVESRELLAASVERSSNLEHELESVRSELRAADDRLLASRVLVQDAQRATHDLAERCAFLESRCETLQEALELAVNASWTTRWKWRREQRARARAQHVD
ncbi:MAG: hypothetical protein KDC46_02840 [Thermoleophilia bacterium]|nr:hypothetical protein [Thermoleophilia bacterium]